MGWLRGEGWREAPAVAAGRGAVPRGQGECRERLCRPRRPPPPGPRPRSALSARGWRWHFTAAPWLPGRARPGLGSGPGPRRPKTVTGAGHGVLPEPELEPEPFQAPGHVPRVRRTSVPSQHPEAVSGQRAPRRLRSRAGSVSVSVRSAVAVPGPGKPVAVAWFGPRALLRAPSPAPGGGRPPSPCSV